MGDTQWARKGDAWKGRCGDVIWGTEGSLPWGSLWVVLQTLEEQVFQAARTARAKALRWTCAGIWWGTGAQTCVCWEYTGDRLSREPCLLLIKNWDFIFRLEASWKSTWFRCFNILPERPWKRASLSSAWISKGPSAPTGRVTYSNTRAGHSNMLYLLEWTRCPIIHLAVSSSAQTEPSQERKTAIYLNSEPVTQNLKIRHFLQFNTMSINLPKSVSPSG